MTPEPPMAAIPRPRAGRTPTPVEDLQYRCAALDAAVKALLAHARAATNKVESDAFRAVGRQLLTERNLMIKKVVARGGHYYTGTRTKLELRT